VDVSSQLDLMLALARTGSHEAAANSAEALLTRFPTSPWILYNAACCYSICGGTPHPPQGVDSAAASDLQRRYLDKAVSAISRAVDRGWKDDQSLLHDPDLRAVRATPQFEPFIRQRGAPAAARAP
jgi:hypothetical protein